MTPGARRTASIGVAAVIVAAGVAAAFALSSTGASATQSIHSSCAQLRSAFQTSGSNAVTTLGEASTKAQAAARKETKYRGFAGAVMRLAGPARVPNVGVVAEPPDLAVVQATCGGAVVPANDAIVVRAPYLTDVTSDSALVNFATDRPFSDATIKYGDAQGGCHLDRTVSTAHSHAVVVGTRTDYLVSLRITSLAPGSRYCYQLGGGVFELSTLETPPTFSTAAAPGDTRAFSFAVIGDWGDGTTDEANVLRQMASSPASFIVTAGDNVYEDGTQANYGDLSGGKVFGPADWPQVGESRATFATQGNHGFSNYQSGLTNWPQPSVVRDSGGRSRRESYCCISTLDRAHPYPSVWYAFDWGPARFYVLDGAWADQTGHYTSDQLAHWNGSVPGCGPCGAELDWLRADLASHASTPLKFAFFHYPLHVDASDHPSDTLLDGPGALEGVLAHAGVDIVFNGHAHLYERNRPTIAGSPMVSYVTGGGGANSPTDTLAAVKGCSAFDAYAIGASRTSCNAPPPADNAAVYHYVLVTVDGRHVTVTPVNENGATFDVQSYSF